VSEQSFLDRRHGGGFFELQISNLLGVMEHALCAERLARESGLLQRFDPRVRLVAMLILIGLAVATHSLWFLYGLFAGSVGLAVLSRIPLTILARGIWLNVAMFTGILALPAIFLVPGEVLFRLPLLGWGATLQGIESATFLIGRATTAATFAALTILATPWPHLLKALRALRVPAVVVVILCMTYRYLFLLLQTALDMFEARRSRLVGRLSGKEKRRMLIADAGVLLSRSLHLADEVFFAMQSRGYRGEMHALLEFRMTSLDWSVLTGLLAAAGLAFRFHP
jgi:cobalt/nickel transport system permease protein